MPCLASLKTTASDRMRLNGFNMKSCGVSSGAKGEGRAWGHGRHAAARRAGPGSQITCGPARWKTPPVRKQAFAWLAERTNAFVNILRPRVRSAVAD